ncbi:hypothetical protein BD779DRAFT_1514822 [Infundibulicybe gibba]|nr:hypothetical protein BD779DRAFT_1514822 [Infundibulicybe gibba]
MIMLDAELNSPSYLVYGAGPTNFDLETIEKNLEFLDTTGLQRSESHLRLGAAGRKPSLYVEIFEDMVDTVWKHEAHLLSEREWDVFRVYQNFCYNTRYCFARLILRKPDQWHPVSTLEKYKMKLGTTVFQHLSLIFAHHSILTSGLTGRGRPTRGWGATNEALGLIDLMSDDASADVKPAISELCEQPKASLLVPSTTASQEVDMEPLDQSFDHLFVDESKMTLHEGLGRLNVDQLKALVKATKSRPLKLTKPEMISTLMSHASTQAVLDFKARVEPSTRPSSRFGKLRQATLPFLPIKGNDVGGRKPTHRSQEARLMEMVLQMLGKCIKVNYEIHQLIRRLHIIAYRSVAYPDALLIPALLTSFGKRTYPKCNYTRDNAIWRTREEYLEYENALRLEAEINEELDSIAQCAKTRSRTRTPSGPAHRFITPMTPRDPSGKSRLTPMRTPNARASSSRISETPFSVKAEGEEAGEEVVDVDAIETESIEKRKARAVKEKFETSINQKWHEFIAAKQQCQELTRTPGLERFEPGYVYTRMVDKAAKALGTLGEYEHEATVLEALLSQRFWRRGKRARWYDRRALIQTRYLSNKYTDQEVLLQALEGIKDALKDNDTGMVFRPGLVRRLRALEKRLKLPEEERCQCDYELKKADVITIKAVRIWKRAEALKISADGRVINGSAASSGVDSYFAPAATTGEKDVLPCPEQEEIKPKEPSSQWKWKGKSIWEGKDKEEVNVEICALQYYESLGFKGFHSETRILTTIFGLLFWDVIFADVEGAFETPYQTAPLDMAEDSFYLARKDIIEARLLEIEAGKGKEILELHDEQFRAQEVFCTGVRWDICDQQDLLEIIECLGGSSLSFICRLFCEDYAGRSSGVPDLIVWNPHEKLCKFVEVKGPGDSPQENQKVYIHSSI